MFLDRTLSKTLEKAGDGFPVILVIGPRQVGKTTLLKHFLPKGIDYVTLDSLSDRHLAQTDPGLFLQRYQPPVIIDEVQYAPDLFSYIKIEADRSDKTGLFWLTGSQQFHLMKEVSETLAGRVGILKLQGLSQREELHSQAPEISLLATNQETNKHAKTLPSLSLKALYARIWRGSFPKIATKEVDHDLFYNSYLQTYIQRDVRDLAQVGDEQAFLRFIRATAARTGQLLNMADIARDVDVDNKTIKHWLSILETSGLIYLLQPYHTNLTKRLIKAPKLYFLDTGLCSFLCRWTSAQSLEAGAMSGAIFETYIVSEILKSYWHKAKTERLYFYRDKDQKEIDLIIEEDGQLHPIEIKKTSRPKKDAIKQFSVLEHLGKPIGPGKLICMVDSHIPLTETVLAVPVSYL